MNKLLAAKVRHMRSESEVAETLLRARLRRERRLRAYMAWRDSVGIEPAATRASDLLHEATRTVDRLETRLHDVRDSAAERYWIDVYAQQ